MVTYKVMRRENHGLVSRGTRVINTVRILLSLLTTSPGPPSSTQPNLALEAQLLAYRTVHVYPGWLALSGQFSWA